MGNRENLIDFMNWYNNNPKEFADNERTVDLYIDSHSPELTCKESLQVHDTLQEGDFFIGTKEEYRRAFNIEKARGYDQPISRAWLSQSLISGYMQYDGEKLMTDGNKITQLTAPEFIRRAENTFNTK